MRLALISLLLLATILSVGAKRHTANWRQATEKELGSLIPARAPVEHERIETEMRTASGVTDGQGKFIVAVVLITAGYSADGKYSHFFITQVPIKIGDIALKPGEYVFGYKRADSDSLEVKFYKANNGDFLGAVKAPIGNKSGAIRSLLITPPGSDRPSIQIGRFSFDYKLGE